MVKDESFEDVELMKEAGFKIDEVLVDNKKFKVKVQFPDYDQTRKNYTYSLRDYWLEETRFVKNGEIYKMKRWKHDLISKIESTLEDNAELKEKVKDEMEEEEGDFIVGG